MAMENMILALIIVFYAPACFLANTYDHFIKQIFSMENKYDWCG